MRFRTTVTALVAALGTALLLGSAPAGAAVIGSGSEIVDETFDAGTCSAGGIGASLAATDQAWARARRRLKLIRASSPCWPTRSHQSSHGDTWSSAPWQPSTSSAGCSAFAGGSFRPRVKTSR